ncbi:MAG: ROK family protein [Aggregatilineales bacterium]
MRSESPVGTILAGVDIGGTKCAVSIGCAADDQIDLLATRRFPTPPTPEQAIATILTALSELAESYAPLAIGISCGGPLNSQQGLILSPPNLPHWDRIDVVSPVRNRFGVPVGLQNDANAGAIAEWKWGAGRGFDNLIFLTFGTGMGAGLILNGKLYAGTNDMAGEIGHIRLEPGGPVGYGKAGSFEGFVSGSGIAQVARGMAEEALRAGQRPAFCPTPDLLTQITAESVGNAAQAGDPLAIRIYEIAANQLGRGLAILVDILNPQRILIGSIYGRQRALLEPGVLQTLRNEALPQSLSVCEIIPAALGERIGDLASLSVALNVLENNPSHRTIGVL